MSGKDSSQAQAVRRAVDLIGSQAKLASIVGKKQQSVSGWANGVPVAAECCIPIERATNGAVTRHELRPDIYPMEDSPFRSRAQSRFRKSAQPARAGRDREVA